MTSRSYCFTLNNYTEAEIAAINLEKFRYIIWGREVGEEGTPHLQGYCELGSPQRLTAMKKLIPRAHFERRLGNRDQARNYCMKDGIVTEHGDWAAGGQGARNDINNLVKAVREGATFTELVVDMPLTVAKHLKFYDRLVQTVEKEETKVFRNVDVHVLIGEAGTGKSRTARDLEPDAFTVNPEDAFPFDGYDGEDAIIIDDFEGQLKYKHLLKILDGHQLRVNVKGGHRYARWHTVFITTNESIDKWYQRGLTPALQRRIKSVTNFGYEEAGNTMPPLAI